MQHTDRTARVLQFQPDLTGSDLLPPPEDGTAVIDFQGMRNRALAAELTPGRWYEFVGQTECLAIPEDGDGIRAGARMTARAFSGRAQYLRMSDQRDAPLSAGGLLFRAVPKSAGTYFRFVIEAGKGGVSFAT